ncbi:hypothetical protein C0389_06995 [bacterium]|nr:hypothetical protein [bacterium]
MNDFSVQKNIEQFYSYKTFTENKLRDSDSSGQINYFKKDLTNPVTSILYSNREKQKSRFIDGFYPIENNTQRWMSKKGLVLIDVPTEANFFFVKGYFPLGFHPGEILTLSVYVEDSLMGEIVVNEANCFTGSIPIVDSLLKKPRQSVLINLIASSSVIPAKYDSQSSDFRDLSMLIHSLGFVNSIESISEIDKNQTIDSKIDQPLHPYFKGKCNICGSQELFVFDNYLMSRESLLCNSCRSSNRIRQLARGLISYFQNRELISTCIKDLAKELNDKSLTIYDTDSNYYVAQLLKEYNGYITSDYRENVKPGTLLGKNHYCQDLSLLTFIDESFDVVLSSDVFEHVRLYQQAIKEIYRVLKPGGVYIFTVPFNSKLDEHETYVEVVDEKDPSKDIDLKPRVYHGDTINSKGALLYRIYGKKLFKEFEKAGFLMKYERTTIPSHGIYDCDLFIGYKPENNLDNLHSTTSSLSTIESSESGFSYNECKWLNIELSSICNLRCQWCILDHSKPAEFLSLTELRKIMHQIENGQLSYLERIELHNGGETLLHPKIEEALEIIRDSRAKFTKPIFITLLTNGTSLKEKTLQLLASGEVVDEIRISVDGGSIKSFEEIRKNAKWSKVSSNVKRFRDAIDQAASKTKLGIICMVPQDKPDNTDWMEEEFKNVLMLADEVEIRHPHSWEGSLPESTGLQANTSLKRPDRLCKFLKNDLVILASGKVTVCCADLNGRGIVGDVVSNTLDEILIGQQRQNIITLWQEGRFDEIPICSTCEGYYDPENSITNIDPKQVQISVDVYQVRVNDELIRKEFIKLLELKLSENAFCEAEILISKKDPAIVKHQDVQEIVRSLNQKRGELRRTLNWTGKKSATTVLQAEQLIEGHKLDSAKKKLLEVVNLEPFHIEALNDLAVVFILQEELDEAAEILNFILLNESANETALGNQKYVQLQLEILQAPEIVSNKITSYKDFMNYSELMQNEFREREVYEKNLLTNDDSFTVRGYCAVCLTQVDFQVDFQYSNNLNGIKTPNWRERLVCPKCNLNNRNRAAIHLIQKNVQPDNNAKIFIAEQTTPLYQYLKENYTNTIGSEFLGDKIMFGASNSDGIRNEDFTNLTFSDNTFDTVLSFDVFEHIPEFQKAFSESYRILKPGGKLLFTVPFNRNAETNLTRAIFENGELKHLFPPEYHGDPLNLSDGCLCYYHFGWEVLEQLKAVGFEDSYLQSFYSKEYGYLGAEQLFIIAEKQSK